MRPPRGSTSYRRRAGRSYDVLRREAVVLGPVARAKPAFLAQVTRHGRDGPADVVGLIVVSEPHRVRRLLHSRHQRREQLVLGEDEVLAAVVGQSVHVAHRQGAGRAGLDAEPTEDAAQVVDLVDAAVALARGEALLLGVVGTLDTYRIRGAGPG